MPLFQAFLSARFFDSPGMADSNRVSRAINLTTLGRRAKQKVQPASRLSPGICGFRASMTRFWHA